MRNKVGHLHPAVRNFREFIEDNPRLRMYFHQMWDEADRPLYTGHTVVEGYEHMFELLSHYIQLSPPWSPAMSRLGSSGLPFSDMFFYAVLTPSGYAAFTDTEVAKEFKKLLQSWGRYLETPKSAVGLGEWLSKSNGCLEKLVRFANAPTKTTLSFEDIFVCDAGKKHYGFSSWDDFFSRRFRPGIRPVCPGGDTVANACESTPLSLARGVKLKDAFWLKETAYSLQDMFNSKSLAREFEGGIVYQAFLSQYSYHRWHAPVSGTIKHAYRIDGTYFAVPQFVETTRPMEGETLEVERCQIPLTSISSRAVIVVEADNHAFGLVAVIAVGLHEVSTVEVTVEEGQHVQKGQQIGMFHFGGSSHCLVFQDHVPLVDFPDVGNVEINLPVNSAIARLKL
jgi:phosphatidylserine decarboxylase